MPPTKIAMRIQGVLSLSCGRRRARRLWSVAVSRACRAERSMSLRLHDRLASLLLIERGAIAPTASPPRPARRSHPGWTVSHLEEAPPCLASKLPQSAADERVWPGDTDPEGVLQVASARLTAVHCTRRHSQATAPCSGAIAGDNDQTQHIARRRGGVLGAECQSRPSSARLGFRRGCGRQGIARSCIAPSPRMPGREAGEHRRPGKSSAARCARPRT